jgi:pyruvate/2-oxoglutarate dehydrogenase complex dihydrolipoamide dehydrogenase (E3) component
MIKFDAIVIGFGQAGNPLAQPLADQGWTVALIEKGHLGGTCVNIGCRGASNRDSATTDRLSARKRGGHPVGDVTGCHVHHLPASCNCL